MKMIMPSHAKNVKRYEENLPLFARYQVESYLAGMFNPTVQLPSGGYIVIDATEALVAVDVNSGRSTKEGSIEQTALKTNLEAAAEVARQLRLRDLAGLIVIDFIDMDERKNNAAVEKMIKDKLKTDRARIQIGRISGFGLMEMSRQRLRPGMIEATTQPCTACHGTGLIRSDDNLALSILRTIEEEGTRRRSGEVLLKAPVGIVNFLMNQKREHIAQIEQRYGMSVRIEGDPHLVSPDFSMEKFKTATRVVHQLSHLVSVDISQMDAIDAADAAEADAAEAAAIAAEAEGNEEEQVVVDAPVLEDGEDKPKRKRRRRRRSRGGRSGTDDQQNDDDGDSDDSNEDEEDDGEEDTSADADAVAKETSGDKDAEEASKPKSRSRSRTRTPKKEAVEDGANKTVEAPAEAEEEKPKPKRTRAPRKPKVDAVAAETVAAADPAVAAEPKPKAPRKSRAAPKKEVGAEVEAEPKAGVEETVETQAEAPVAAAEPERAAEQIAAPVPEAKTEPLVAPEPVVIPEPVAEAVEEPAKPRRKGWWSLGGR
jgi:ribonuclease E